MLSNILFWTIIIICIADFIYDIVMYKLNRKASHQPIPAELSGLYDEKAYARQQEYSAKNAHLSIINSCVGSAILLGLFYFGVFGQFDQWARDITSYPILVSMIFFGLIFLCSWIPEMPFGIYDTFVIEEKFGFNRTTPKTYALDTLKSLLMTLIIGGGIVALLAWIYSLMPQVFWIVAWSALTVIMLFMQFFYSDIIVPLFNKQTPLEEGELRTAIEAFAKKVDFKLKDIYVMDGSKRSSHANAYFTGFGARKRIVIYDTLMEQLTTEEIVGVLAHEIGHYKHNHIVKGIISSLITNLLMFFLFGLVLDSQAIAEAAGASVPSFHINLMVFSLIYTPVSEVLSVVDNIISRRNEWQADEFARANGLGAPVADALKKMSAKSLSNLTPHPAVVFVKHSHPTLLSRVKHLYTR